MTENRTPSSPDAAETATADSSLVDRPLTGPRQLPLGRTEQLFGIRRRPEISVEDGMLHSADLEIGNSARGLDGRLTGGAAAVMMDNLTAVGVHHAAGGLFPAVVTTELQVNVLRPLPPMPQDGPRVLLSGHAEALSVDAGGGAARGVLRGPDGTAYVEAVGWFQAIPGVAPESVEAFRRNAQLPLDESTDRPMAELLGLDPESVEPADPQTRPQVTEAFRPGPRFSSTPQLHNPGGAVHGGAMALRALVAAQAALPDRELYDVQALRVLYVRPGHGDQESRVRVRHAGRSLRVVDVELVPAGTWAASVTADDDGAGSDVTPGTGATSEPRQPVKPMVQVQVTFRTAR